MILEDIELKINNNDLYDIAYKWGWENEKLNELVYLCYKTPNLKENARRFYKSDEFNEAIDILTKLGKVPNTNLKVLDFGCGNGVASYSLARKGYSVTALDSSLGELAGINAAKKLIGIDGIDFEIVHSVGEDGIHFQENSFDIVWMREVFHHIKDLKGFLEEVKRILKKDGVICCLRDHVVWNEQQRDEFYKSHPFYHITKDEGCYYLHEYTNAFRDAGMKLEVILDPCSSVINFYPRKKEDIQKFDLESAVLRTKGNDLFSFFARKTTEVL